MFLFFHEVWRNFQIFEAAFPEQKRVRKSRESRRRRRVLPTDPFDAGARRRLHVHDQHHAGELVDVCFLMLVELERFYNPHLPGEGC